MTTIATRPAGTALSIDEGQREFNTDQVAVLNQLGVANASREDLAVFFHQSVRTGLDPFAKQIYMIERQGKQTIQTGIDGFRLIARRAVDRTGETLGYEDTLWCGEDGQWVDVWLKREAPAAAKATVLRNGQRYAAVALFNEYAGRKRDGNLMQMWATKGALMIAKCAEALALRKAFPQDLSGIYTGDEMQQADREAMTERRDQQAQRTAGTASDRLRQSAQPTTVEGEVIDETTGAIEPEPVIGDDVRATVDRLKGTDEIHDYLAWATQQGAPQFILDFIEATIQNNPIKENAA